jgi:hypothetical protein
MKGKARKAAKEQAELTPRAAAVLLVGGKLPEVATSISGDAVIRLDDAREIERRLNAFAEYRRWALHVLKGGRETGTAFLLREAGRVAAVCDEASCCDLANAVRLVLPAIEDEDFERAGNLERKILSNPEARSWFGVIRAIEIALSVSIVPAYNPVPMGDAAHDLNALAANLGLTFEEAAAKLTARETTGRATAEPRPKLTPQQIREAKRQISEAKLQVRLDRLERRYEQRLKAIELPPGGFTTKKQADAAARLATNLRDVQKLQTELGCPVSEWPDRVTEAESMASAYRRTHTKTGEIVPRRPRGRPRRNSSSEQARSSP